MVTKHQLAALAAGVVALLALLLALLEPTAAAGLQFTTDDLASVAVGAPREVGRALQCIFWNGFAQVPVSDRLAIGTYPSI